MANRRIAPRENPTVPSLAPGDGERASVAPSTEGPPTIIDRNADPPPVQPEDLATGRKPIYEWEFALVDVLRRLRGIEGKILGGIVYNQAAPAASWQVIHNYGVAPNVLVIDASGGLIEGDVVHAADLMSVTVSFSVPLAGTAYVRI